MTELTTFAKINLAACAVKRAEMNWKDNDRFAGEYETVRLWKSHRVIQTHLHGSPWGYVTVA